jgi:hypothetical protein
LDPVFALIYCMYECPNFSTFKEPMNRFQWTNDSPIPSRFVAPINCLKIPAQFASGLVPTVHRPHSVKFVKRRKIRLIEVNSKCSHLKQLTCKGTLWQVFTRVYRLSPVAPLPYSLVQLSPTPPLFPRANKYTVYTYTVGYNDFNFLDKMEPPKSEIDVKWDSKTQL